MAQANYLHKGSLFVLFLFKTGSFYFIFIGI
jgi:hypothetical protein